MAPPAGDGLSALGSTDDAYHELQGLEAWDAEVRARVDDTRSFASMYWKLHLKPTVISMDEATKRIQTSSENILKSFRMVRDVLARHETTITKRWHKKTGKQRRQLLTTAWGPDINRDHRSDLAALLTLQTNTAKVANLRTRFLWPHINLEDLSSPRNLLNLLQDRVSQAPPKFAQDDLDLLRFPHAMLFMSVVVREENFGIKFDGSGGANAALYVPKLYDTRAIFKKRRSEFLEPDVGFLILEVQEKTMSFLQACIVSILQDIPERDLLNHPIQTSSAQQTLMDSASQVASWTDLARDVPYKLNAVPNYTRLLALVTARKEAAVEHLWSMREDPGYFAEAVRERCSDTHTDERSDAWHCGVWTYSVAEETWRAVSQAKFWTELRRICKSFCDLQTGHKGAKEDAHAVGQASYELVSLVGWHLREEMYALQSTWLHSKLGTTKFCKCCLPRQPGRARFKELLDLFLYSDCFERPMMPEKSARAIAEMQYLIDTDETISLGISAEVEVIIANVGVASECFRQLRRCMPVVKDSDIMPWMLDRSISKLYFPHDDVADQFSEGELGELLRGQGDRGWECYQYPIHKTPTRERVEQMRASEKELDKFWKTFEEQMKGSLFLSVLGNCQPKKRILHRTPEWVEPSAPAAPEKTNTTWRDQVELDFELQILTERTININAGSAPLRIKAATKTHEPRRTSVESDHQTKDLVKPVEVPEAAVALSSIYSINARALKVFKTIFFVPTTDAMPGEIQWKEFVHAMVSMGFCAEKIYGSVWLFTPTRPEFERSINFHEPHPGNKIPFWTARRHGRRLERVYGWKADMFKLAEKGQKV